MDPGNWITSIGGGAQFGYLLLSVIAISSAIAMLLQYMSAKLGIVTQMDLAQATRPIQDGKPDLFFGSLPSWLLWPLISQKSSGGAIALQLLFAIPLSLGVMITVFDVLLLLLLTRFGFRRIEALVACLITVIMAVFLYEVMLADPQIGPLLNGFIPKPEILHHDQLVMALGIIGATVMPHNLYLHSSIAQTRKYDRTDEASLAKTVRFAAWDSNIQLSVAFIVNCLLLILGSASFWNIQ